MAQRHFWVRSVLAGVLLGTAAVDAAPNRWRQVGPPTAPASIGTLAFDPTDARIAFAGLVEGGVARSLDGGVSWTLRSPELGGFASPVAIAVSPVAPTTVYVASSSDVWKSLDRGDTWQRLPVPPSNYGCLALDPRDAGVAYVGGSGGVWRTRDGGVHWRRLSLSASPLLAVVSIAIDPTNPARLYVGAKEGTHVYLARTLDGGRTWARVRSGLPFQILIHPADPRRVYTTGPAYVQASTDGGDHWRGLLDVPGVLALDPVDTRILYLAAQASEGRPRTILKSTDGGLHWRASRRGFPAEVPSGVWIAPSDRNRLLASGQLGLGLYASGDAARHWARAGDGLVNAEVRAFAVGGNGGIYASSTRFPPPLAVSHDRGASWESHLGNDEAGFEAYLHVAAVAVSPHDARTVYVGIAEPRGERRRQAIWKTEDGGVTWRGLDIGLESAWVYDLAVDPFDGRWVYAGIALGEQSGFYASANGGESWARVGQVGDKRTITELAVDPEHEGTLYAASSGLGLFKSMDRGTRWTMVLASPENEALSHVAIAPSDPRVVYAAGWKRIFRSTDGGATWATLPGLTAENSFQFADFGDHPLAVDPLDPLTLYGAGVGGVFRKVHDGPWIRLAQGLVQAQTHGLRFDPEDPGLLYVSTTAAGIFTRRVRPR